MAGPYDLTGQNIEDTYQRILQTPDGSTFYDGTGSLVNVGGTVTPGNPNTSVQFNGNGVFSGSSNFTFNSASNALTLTGSLNVSGSTTQVGNNTLLGNTTLSGSIIISGSTTTPTVQVYGNVTHDGYIRFNPVSTNIDQSISASYIYVSGSTNDLYFSQNGAGYSNTTRLRWLEGNLYTGLLHGGIITTQSSTVYQISSGSGVIVTLNASLNDDPYPTVQYLSWPNLSASIAPLSASYDQSFVSINSLVQITASGIPYNDGDYNTLIPIGIVLHQNRSTINGVQTFPSVGYGWKQRSYDFIKAFGPLKISNYNLSPSSSRGLLLTGGVAWVDGRNYTINPNNPSYITEATGITTSKIFRYYQSGSGWVYDTNAGIGYTVIDPTQYSNSGSLTSVSSNHWTIQRVFYFPNSATKALFVYYGNAQYSNKTDAIAALLTEPFNEAPNTAANAIFVGYMLLRNNADFTTAASYEFRSAGLFRGSGAGGAGGGGGGATTLAALTDVSLTSPTYGDLLMYDSTYWYNTKTLSGSYTLSGSLTTNDGVWVQSLTASFISASSITGSLFGTASYATTASSFFSTQTQTAGAINTPYSMSFNNIDITNGVTISGSTSSSIKIANAGVYDLQFSAQLQKQGSGGGVANVLIWIRKNNIDIASTNTYVQLQGGTNSKTVAAWNWFLNAAAGDEYRIMWATDDTNAEIYYDPTPITGPTVPSIIATVARVDQFLSNTGSFSGSFHGEFTGSLLGTASYSNYTLSSSYSDTASYVNPLNQTVQITGSLAVNNGNVEVLDTTTFVLKDSTGLISVGWDANILYDGFATASLDWKNRLLTDALVSNSIDWDYRYQYDGMGINSIEWNNRTLKWTDGTTTILDWGSAQAYDRVGAIAIDWSNSGRKLQDLATAVSVDWANRVLYKSDGTTVSVDWENGILTGSLHGTSSWAENALTASYVNGIITKANEVVGGTFGGTPLTASVTFTSAFPNTNYTVTVTGEDARIFTIQNKLAGGFEINTNSSVILSGNVYWQAISYGEFNG